ncbi:MAG: hypothetical protein GC158_11435 [Cyanobacteria bacterium RI_101]|nr:hypothetical protein [Cyanobacteria bacterium RI_101]
MNSIPPVKEGERFILTRDVATHGLTTWAAPVTGSFECRLPQGTRFKAYEQAPGARGFCAVPEDYETLEKQLVPEGDRKSRRYTGYYFVFLIQDIGDALARVD